MSAPAASAPAEETPLLVRVRRRKPRPRFRWRWWLLGGGVALLVLLGFEGYRYAAAALALRDGRDRVQAAQQLLAADLAHLDASRIAAAQQDLHEAALDFGARSQLISSGWIAQIAMHLPWLSDQVKGAGALRTAGSTGTAFAVDLVQLAQRVVATSGAAGSTSPLPRIVTLADQQRGSIQRAQADLRAFEAALGLVPRTALIGPLESARETLLHDGAAITAGAGPALTMLDALPQAIGPGTHRYVVLLENPGEERPSGGYIGAVGVVAFKDGRLTGLQFLDSSSYPPPAAAVPVPGPLDTYLFHGQPWGLEDANWSPDFPTAMAQVEQFFTADTGLTVDGEISVDPVAIEYLLQLLGPVQVAPYPQVITARNALQELNYITNHARPGDPGKAFLAPFGQAVTQRVLQTPVAQLPALVSSLQRAALEKHVVAYFHQPGLERLVDGAGVGGAVQPASSDSVMVDDANLSGSKADLFVQRTYALDVHVNPDGSAADRLTLTYSNPVVTNPADKALLPGSGGQYRDYVRVLVPETAQLQSVSTSIDGAVPAQIAPDSVTYQFEQQAIGIWFVVPVGATEQITLTYAGPFADVSVNPERYQLTWVKQVNALDWPVSVAVHMPSGRVERWSASLSTDRTWSAG
ncbi:MAG TPA: DUF4012 domain-containing protein [Candidatus Dormibacteraeota bacterium]